jgi:hypothetical protein
MIPANLKPSILIKESNQYFYHLQMTKVRINPADPTHPITTVGVRPMRSKDYNNFFVIGTAEAKIRHLKSMGLDSVEVVHDPSLLKKDGKEEKTIIPEKKISFRVISDEDKIEEARLAELEAKEKEKAIKAKAKNTKVTGRKGGKR